LVTILGTTLLMSPGGSATPPSSPSPQPFPPPALTPATRRGEETPGGRSGGLHKERTVRARKGEQRSSRGGLHSRARPDPRSPRRPRGARARRDAAAPLR